MSVSRVSASSFRPERALTPPRTDQPTRQHAPRRHLDSSASPPRHGASSSSAAAARSYSGWTLRPASPPPPLGRAASWSTSPVRRPPPARPSPAELEQEADYLARELRLENRQLATSEQTIQRSQRIIRELEVDAKCKDEAARTFKAEVDRLKAENDALRRVSTTSGGQDVRRPGPDKQPPSLCVPLHFLSRPLLSALTVCFACRSDANKGEPSSRDAGAQTDVVKPPAPFLPLPHPSSATAGRR